MIHHKPCGLAIVCGSGTGGRAAKYDGVFTDLDPVAVIQLFFGVDTATVDFGAIPAPKIDNAHAPVSAFADQRVPP
jgi:hypothetical protein